MMRAQAMIALSGIADVDERFTAAVERSPVILDPGLAEMVEQLIASSHVRAPYFGSGGGEGFRPSRTRGRSFKYAWER
jgi:hypothetical protein